MRKLCTDPNCPNPFSHWEHDKKDKKLLAKVDQMVEDIKKHHTRKKNG